MSKFHNKKITYNGVTYDSKKEYYRAIELDLMLRAGKIRDLQRQVKYVLIPQQKEGKKVLERECSYVADFRYIDTDTNEVVVEDVKGVKTKEYRIKKKLMLWIFGIKIKEV